MPTSIMEARRRPLMKTKVCTICKVDKPVEEFYKQPFTRHSFCYGCKREYNKERYAKLKKRANMFKI